MIKITSLKARGRIKVRELYNKKKQRRIIFLAAFLALAFSAGALFDFNENLAFTERSRTKEFLTEWTKQNAEKVSMKIDRYYNALEYAAKLIKDPNVGEKEEWKMLKEELMSKNTDFDSLLILNAAGRSVDEETDHSKEIYFRPCIYGNKGFSMNGSSYEDGMILSVPIYNEERVFKGAVCGIVSSQKLSVFQKNWNFIKESDLYLIDKNGDYIIKQEITERAGSNFFEELESEELSVDLPTMKFRFQNRVAVPFELNISSDDGKIAVIAPVKTLGLCVVSIVNEDQAYRINRKYQAFVIFLTIKLVGAFALIAAVYLHFQRQDNTYIRNLNQRLMMNEETYRITARNSDTCVFTYDVETGQIQFLNDKFKDLGLEQSEMSIPIFVKRMDEIHPEVAKAIRQILCTIDKKETSHMQKMAIQSNRQLRYLSILTTNIFDESGEVSRMVGSIGDVTNNENNLRKLKKEEGFRNSLLSDSLGYMIVDVDRDTIVEATPSILRGRNPKDFTYTEVLGYFLSRSVRSDHWSDLQEKMSCQAFKRLFSQKMDTKIYEYLVVDPHQEDIWFSCEVHLNKDSISNDLIAYLVYRNIDEIKRQQENLEKRATVDLLTGAWNRGAGTARIEEILRTTPDEGCVHVFAIADLDNFKELNDIFGHMWGDKALYEVVRIMKKHCRDEDVVCRLGGDEFVLFMQNIPQETVEHSIQALSHKLHICYQKGDAEVMISVSMGVAMAKKSGSRFQELYERADAGLYQVKRNNKGFYHICDETFW